MNPEKHKQFADRWLDIALKQYSDVEPSSGCESRIIATLAGASGFSLLRPMCFAWTELAAALVLGAVFLGTWLERSPTQTHSAQTAQSAKSPPVVEQTSAPSRIPEITTGPLRHRTQKSRAVRPVPTRHEQFPSPAPLSQDEQLLIAYLRSTPKEEIQLAASRTKFEQERAQELPNFDTTLDQEPKRELQ